MLETVTYRSLQDVVVRAGRLFPDSSSFSARPRPCRTCSAATSTGYYRDEAATAESFRGGWFHTGDLGRMDKRGFLYFQGRVKNLIVLSNGENVSPEELETQLYQLNGVRDAIMYEKNQQITAEVYADPAVFPDEAALWRSVNEINRHLPPYKQIGNLIYWENEFKKPRRRKSSAAQLRRQHHERVNSGDPCRGRRRAGIGPA